MFTAASLMLPALSARADTLASIRLTVERSVIKADGRSTTVISAEVRDSSGRVVPDGTRIAFATTAGRLSSPSEGTQNGVARVVLTSSDLPDTAVVTANLDGAGQAVPAQTIITFAADVDAAETGTTWIRVDGKDYTGYAVNEGIIQLIGKGGKANLAYRAYTVHADSIQFNIKENVVLATGNVTLEASGEKREYLNLKFSLMQGVGAAERLDENGASVPLLVRGPALTETPYDGSLGEISAGGFWDPEDISEAALVVVANSIAIDPGTALQFRRATFYLDGLKTLSLPFHVMNFGQESLFREQIVGYGPQGLTVDVPIYYDVRPTGIGTVHVRRGERVGSSAYSTRPGWTMDIEQAYNGKNGQEGVFQLSGITRQDWSARLHHAQRLGRSTRGSVYIDTPNHRDVFLTTQVSRAFNGFALNFAGSGSLSPGSGSEEEGTAFQGGGNLRAQLYAETTPRVIKGVDQVRYSVNVGMARQYLYGASAAERSRIDTQNATLRLFSNPVPVARQTSLTQSLSLGQTWVGTDGSRFGLMKSGASIYATTALNHSLSSTGSLRLSYDYAQTPLINTNVQSTSFTSVTGGRHRLGLTAYLAGGNRWNVSLTAAQGLDSPTATLYGTGQISLGGDWRARVTHSASKFGDLKFQETEFALIKRIAGRDFAVYYSTTSKQFQLDLTGARF